MTIMTIHSNPQNSHKVNPDCSPAVICRKQIRLWQPHATFPVCISTIVKCGQVIRGPQLSYHLTPNMDTTFDALVFFSHPGPRLCSKGTHTPTWPTHGGVGVKMRCGQVVKWTVATQSSSRKSNQPISRLVALSPEHKIPRYHDGNMHLQWWVHSR